MPADSHEPIPDVVFFDIASDSFYDTFNRYPMNRMGPAFKDVWYARRAEFPQSPEEWRQRSRVNAARAANPTNPNGLVPAPQIKTPMLPAYLLLGAASVTPIAFQTAAELIPAINGIGVTVSMCVITYALFLLGTLEAFTRITRK